MRFLYWWKTNYSQRICKEILTCLHRCVFPLMCPSLYMVWRHGVEMSHSSPMVGFTMCQICSSNLRQQNLLKAIISLMICTSHQFGLWFMIHQSSTRCTLFYSAHNVRTGYIISWLIGCVPRFASISQSSCPHQNKPTKLIMLWVMNFIEKYIIPQILASTQLLVSWHRYDL